MACVVGLEHSISPNTQWTLQYHNSPSSDEGLHAGTTYSNNSWSLEVSQIIWACVCISRISPFRAGDRHPQQ